MSEEFKDAAASRTWANFDTILLDMDGTLLDLAFDNYFWRELIPRCVARQRDISEHLACTPARRARSTGIAWISGVNA